MPVEPTPTLRFASLEKVVSPEEWASAKRHGYAMTKPDGTRYMLYLDAGATVWGPVSVHDPLA